MKRILFFATLLATSLLSYAQDVTYHLPKTAIKVSVMVEKKSYTPGDLCDYAQKFLKKRDVSQEKSVTYRMLSAKMSPMAVPDTSKVYTAHIDQKRNIQKLALSENNILLAINAEPKAMPAADVFTPARKPAPLDPYKYLNQDILSVGSKMKMASLCAREIYDIRESKNELTRGQAEQMPKDGEQLRIMLNSLDTQETAILQLFEGVTVCDTSVVEIMCVPEKELKDGVLFRFSKFTGVVDPDNLSGDPYLISIINQHSQPEHIMEQGKRAVKDETGLWICLPGKIRVELANSAGTVDVLDVSAAQFGDVENLNEPLFTKKILTSIVLNPYNGGIEKIDSQVMK